MIYTLLKRVILAGNYNKEDMLNKLDIYLFYGRITEEQYAELVALVNAE
jgi:hypothetical protein